MKSLRSFSAAGLAVLLSTAAMSQDVISLWPAGAVPNNRPEAAAVAEKTQTNPGDVLIVSQVTVPTLTVFPAAKGKTTGAAVMICPGGGYWVLASGHEGADIARWFAERGVTAFVLKYRLPDEKIQTNAHEVPLQDAMQGMKLIRQNASRYGVDAQRIGVMGFSAGGHLASTLATHYHRPPLADEAARPNFAVLVYPVVTFGDKAHSGSRDKLLGALRSNAAQIERFSNEKQVTAQTPATFLVHSQDDTGVPVENSIGFFLACKAANVPAEMHLYPTGGHGYGMRVADKGSVAGWPQALESWLRSRGILK